MTTTFNIESVNPVYRKNYKKGYIGFTYNNNNIISQGIAYFTRWSKISDINATHALVVTGENECIEAHATTGVRRANLEQYFQDKHCQIFFRKPNNLTNFIADQIVQTLIPEIGKQYDFNLITSQALSGTFLGRFFDTYLKGQLEDTLTKILNEHDKWICSELAAYALDEQVEYRDKGILTRPNATISPQELFEDTIIFEDWKQEIIAQ
jgi:hypothetical protein